MILLSWLCLLSLFLSGDKRRPDLLCIELQIKMFQFEPQNQFLESPGSSMGPKPFFKF